MNFADLPPPDPCLACHVSESACSVARERGKPCCAYCHHDNTEETPDDATA